MSKVDREIRRYANWLGLKPGASCTVVRTRIHRSGLCVEDADSEILLDYDRGRLDRSTFDQWFQIASFSGACFQELYDAATLRDWRDPARDRETFYGIAPCSIREVYQHVDRVQGYYLQCLGLSPILESCSFVGRRCECLSRITGLYERNSGCSVIRGDGEEWTTAKALRRYIWHDHIHAKSIVRTLQRQLEAGLIDRIHDPFKFGTLKTSVRSDLV
ncbi:MAG: hypothetical protein OXR72_14115 [Gemmatimonadota bacterium]|nr:hypothetical protein [Gemmatimonadota bacterium]